jgi:hypothetical protein
MVVSSRLRLRRSLYRGRDHATAGVNGAGRVDRHPEKASELRIKPERAAGAEGGPADG